MLLKAWIPSAESPRTCPAAVSTIGAAIDSSRQKTPPQPSPQAREGARWSAPAEKPALACGGGLGWGLTQSQPPHAVLAAMHRRGQHAEDLEHHRRADQRGVAARIERRRDLHDIAADEVEAFEAADHPLRLGRREATHFGWAGARRLEPAVPRDVAPAIT